MKCLSFFSGCLGLDLGLEKAGIKSVLYCENDAHAQRTIMRNRPEVPLISDILDYTAASILDSAGLKNASEVDLIVGGPPCQAFSTAGKRASFDDPRGNVFLHFIDIISDIRPNYFVIENVRGLLSAALAHRPHSQRGTGFPALTHEEESGGALKLIVSKLEREGYEISFNLYNTANYGVPQKRERLIIIGSLKGRVPYLKPTHESESTHGLKKWATFADVAKDMKSENHEHVKFPEKRLKYYKLLTGGQYWRDLPDDVVEEAMGASFFSGGGKTGFYRRIAWDKPSPTLVTHPAMPATDLCHPDELRPLSVEEYKRIQQIPDGFDIEGPTLQKYRQIGNAVPVGFGQAIGKMVLSHSQRQNLDDSDYRNVAFSRYKHTSDLDWKFSKASDKRQVSMKF